MMLTRAKQPPKDPNRPPDPFWLLGAVIGLSLGSMAAGAMAMGTGLAIGKAVTTGT